MIKFHAWFVLYFIAPIFLLPGYGVLEQGLIASSSLILCSVWLAYYSSFRSGQFVGITFWVFSYVFMIVAPAAQFLAGGYPWNDFYSNQEVEFASLVVFIGLLSVSVGSVIPIKNLKRSFSLNQRKLKIFVFISIALASVSLIYHGVEKLFLPRAEQSGSGESTPVDILLQSFFRVPVFIASLVIFNDSTNRGFRNIGINKLALTVGLTVLVLVINNPISTPRFWFGCVLFSYFFVTVHNVFKSLEKYIAPILIFLMLVVFPISDIFRRTLDVDINAAIESFELYEEISFSPDYDAFQQLINTVLVVEASGLTWGRQTIGAFLFWVPRSIWPDKPILSGAYVAEQRNYKYVNLSCPLWAEAFLDFGLVGVFLVFFLYGLLIRMSIGKSGIWLVFFIFYAAFQPYLLRGSLMVASNFLLLAILCFTMLASRPESKTIDEIGDAKS